MQLRLALLALFAVCAAYGQTASLTGRVSDSSGAVIPGARVEVRNVGTGIAAVAETNAEGYYNAPSLAPGTYDITVS